MKIKTNLSINNCYLDLEKILDLLINEIHENKNNPQFIIDKLIINKIYILNVLIQNYEKRKKIK